MDSKADFYRTFQLQVSTIEVQIDALAITTPTTRTHAIESCLSAISYLSTSVQDAAAASSIPPHDQRTYTQAIKDLNERLARQREAVAPRAKFAFKSKKNVGPVGGAGDVRAATAFTPEVGITSTTPQTAESISTSSTAPHGSTTKPQPPPTVPAPPTLRTKQLIRLPHNPLSNPIITDLSSCIILPPSSSSSSDFSPAESTQPHPQPTYPTLTLKNITSSLLILPHITGPLHATSLHRTTLVIPRCGQFRMHDCTDCDVYLWCGTRPVVEGVEDIRFAPVDVGGLGGGGNSEDGGGSSEDGGDDKGTQDAGETGNKWDQIDDFKWLHADKKSPNWRVMLDRERGEGRRVWEVVLREAEEIETEMERGTGRETGREIETEIKTVGAAEEAKRETETATNTKTEAQKGEDRVTTRKRRNVEELLRDAGVLR